MTPHPYFAIPTPIVAAHRGASGEAPENTRVAFERALRQGAVILETDVQGTRDGVPVVFHDDEVDRTTDGNGPIRELSWDEVRRLDAGHGFSTDGGRSFPFRGHGIRVDSLAETFAAFPGVRFNIELKQTRRELIERTLDEVSAAGRAAVTLLTSETDDRMALLREEVRRRGVPVALGASAGEVAAFLDSASRGVAPPPGPMALQIPLVHEGIELVTPRLIEHAHRHGVQVHVWTVNDPAEMERLLDLGIDALITDYPARFADVVARRGP